MGRGLQSKLVYKRLQEGIQMKCRKESVTRSIGYNRRPNGTRSIRLVLMSTTEQAGAKQFHGIWLVGRYMSVPKKTKKKQGWAKTRVLGVRHA